MGIFAVGVVCALVSGVGIVIPCAAFVVSRPPSKAPGAEPDPGGNTVEINKIKGKSEWKRQERSYCKN